LYSTDSVIGSLFIKTIADNIGLIDNSSVNKIFILTDLLTINESLKVNKIFILTDLLTIN
jgi:hypothetical protein